MVSDIGQNGLNGCKAVDTNTEVYERRQSILLLTSRPVETHRYRSNAHITLDVLA